MICSSLIRTALPNNNRWRHSLYPVLCLLLALSSGCGTTTGAGKAGDQTPERLTAEQVQSNVESFDYIWKTIRDKHWDPDLGGLDWSAVRDELRPQVVEATTMGEARAAMQQMIARLDQTHFAVFPSSVYKDASGLGDDDDDSESGTNTGGHGATGMDVRVIDNQAVVVSVDPESPAARAGVEPGWEIVRVGEVDIPPRLVDLTTEIGDKTYAGLTLARSVTSRLRGNIGDSLSVGLLDHRNDRRDLHIPLAEARGKLSKFGNLPESRVWHDKRTLDGNVGYFGFNWFLDMMQIMPAFNQAVQDFMECRGMIIDLRGNGGGIGGMAMGMAGWFFADKGHRLGVMTMRDSEIKFVINPRLQMYSGPVAVLVDNLSASTSEILAGGLQDLGRAHLFGTRTAGAALPSMIERLPNGDGFQYAVANYISDGGDTLEANGVVPDVEIVPTRSALRADPDPVLTAARQWILQTDRSE